MKQLRKRVDGMSDVVNLAMRRAVKSFGGNDGVFNGAGFGIQLMKLANLDGVIDGNLVEVILCGREDVIQLQGGSHYLMLEFAPKKARGSE
jgi:NAD(P)-dependent dehydrogenase (short-subunit alcohol dehydrogenase family)